MKNIVSILIALLASGSPLRAQNGDSWAKVNAEKKGTLSCIWNESYGIIYKDDDNRLKGVCMDILNDFAAYIKSKYQAEIKLEFSEEKDFSKYLSRVSSSRNLLGVSSTAITTERQTRFLFSPYFLMNPNIIVTNRNGKPIVKIEDIAISYPKVKVVEGSIHAEYVKKIKSTYHPDLIIEYAASSRTILEELKANPTMFTILDFSEYLGACRTKTYLTRQSINLELMDKIGFVMNKNSDWGQVWSEFLTSDYRKSIGYRKIIANNLGASYAYYLSGIEAK